MIRNLTPPTIVIHPDPKENQIIKKPTAELPIRKASSSVFDPNFEKECTVDVEEKHVVIKKRNVFTFIAVGLCRCLKKKKPSGTETVPETKYEV